MATFETEDTSGRNSLPDKPNSSGGSNRGQLAEANGAAAVDSDDAGDVVIPESMAEFVLQQSSEGADSSPRSSRSASVLWNGAKKAKEKSLHAYLNAVQQQQADGNHEQDAEIIARMLEAQIAGAKMISPNSSFRSRWDAIQAVFLSYIAFVVPYRIGFDNDASPDSFWFWFDLFIDIYFVVDVFLNFRTAFFTGDGEMEYRPKVVANTYLHGWFTIDVLGCLPFNYVVYVVPDNQLDSTDMRGNRVLRMMRLARLLKILRLVRFKRLLERWEEELYNVSALKLLKLVVFILVIGHWLSCAWYYFGNDQSSSELDHTGAPLTGWVERSFGGIDGVSNTDRYITSLYWSFMTLTTVGFGDIHPVTFSEKCYR